jgi:hypothetical protein
MSAKPTTDKSPTETSALTSNISVNLDEMTSGAFSAQTSGDRSAKIRDWLSTDPSALLLQEVYKELSSRDKGAAKLVKERLDDLKRQKSQESTSQEWAVKAQVLLEQAKINIADALAWQRDAAKAGAALSKEPLASLKAQLADRVKVIEDLQRQCLVQREAAVLLAQRTEVLSTKPFSEVKLAKESLEKDIQRWVSQADDLVKVPHWSSVDSKFAPLLEVSKSQLLAVWNAFSEAVAQVESALLDTKAPMPSVPVWADEVRAVRGLTDIVPKANKPKTDPQVKEKANQTVQKVLAQLEAELALGHGKATVLAANALRNALKDFGHQIDHKLEVAVTLALTAAGELEGWQRWRADQIRQELVEKAKALLNRPAGQALGGKKLQETLRSLRDQWKVTDQGGVPNHVLWKRFDEACNEAHKLVDQWVEKLKAENSAHREQRLAIIADIQKFTQSHTADAVDLKALNRQVQQFVQTWQESGHVGEKTYAELQPLWKQAMDALAAPLKAAQQASLDLRHQLTEQAEALGKEALLNIDAIKALQQRWQAEAQRVPLERKLEQKLWDKFRQPLDDAFARKTAEREKLSNAINEFDRQVTEASKVVKAAIDSADAQAIRTATDALNQLLQNGGRVTPVAPTVSVAPVTAPEATAETLTETTPAIVATEVTESAEVAASEEPVAKPVAAPKPVIARRGDDRPQAKISTPTTPVATDRFANRKGNERNDRGDRSNDRNDRNGPRSAGAGAGVNREPRFAPREPINRPRLSDAAFRAQKQAFDAADMALRQLAMQAHGEVLTQVITAWEKRDANTLPATQALGSKVNASSRQAWVKAISQAPSLDAKNNLLRLEIATESPTPAALINERRALQLQMLTKRNEAAPIETWSQDVAAVMASDYNEENAKRLQNVLKVLLRQRG